MMPKTFSHTPSDPNSLVGQTNFFFGYQDDDSRDGQAIWGSQKNKKLVFGRYSLFVKDCLYVLGFPQTHQFGKSSIFHGKAMDFRRIFLTAVLYSKPFTAFLTTVFQNQTTAFSPASDQESMSPFSLDLARLVCSFHDFT